MPSVYCSGPLQGCSEVEAKGWRAEAKILLSPFEVNDPCTRWTKGGYSHLSMEEKLNLVALDLEEIQKSDGLLVNVWKPSFGTAQEMVYSYLWRIPTCVICPFSDVSPWLIVHSDKIVSSVEEGCRWLKSKLG